MNKHALSLSLTLLSACLSGIINPIQASPITPKIAPATAAKTVPATIAKPAPATAAKPAPGAIPKAALKPAAPAAVPPDSPQSLIPAPLGSPHNLLAGYSPVILELEKGAAFPYPRLEGLFSHFQVIDERPDTARIGIHTDGKTPAARTRQMVLGHPVAGEVASYLNRHWARPNAPYTALIVLRTLWLSDAMYIKEELMKAPEKRFEKGRVRVRAEIYAVRDSSYMPLYRFDSLHTSRKNSYKSFVKDLTAMLDLLADSASIVLTDKRESGRLISFEDIRAFNQARFDISISRDTTLQPGVYASYEEFRNNAPSISNYEIKNEDNNLIIYIRDANGKSWYNHSAFGYCDGKNVYIMKDGILRPAWREGKGWYFFGRTNMEKHSADDPNIDQLGVAARTIPVMNGVPLSAVAHTFLNSGNELSRIRVFALDMDNGGVF